MIIKNKRLLDFFLKYNIDYESLLLKVVDIIEPIIENKDKQVNYNLLLESFTNDIRTTIFNSTQNIDNTINNIDKNLSEYINYIKISSNKGKIKENTYFLLLSKHFSEYEITNCSEISNSMDILMIVDNIDIRIDIKDYASNVPLREINKFHSDIISNQCHGILISDSSGISNHENFTFTIIQNKYIAFYISNNVLNITNIKNAINFIKTIHSYVSKTDTKKIFYNENIIQQVSILLNTYATNIKNLKVSLQNCTNLCNKLTMDNLLNLLNINYESQSDALIENFPCDICNNHFDTLRKLTNHQKKCLVQLKY
jgi:hypothetical protein